MEVDEEFDYGPILKMTESFLQSGFDGLKNFHAQRREIRQKRRNRWKNRLGL